ncbi:protein POF1B isoform X2 [Sebastes umbrosus]|uniref:protein POF1B isoform X2 n=1 Tax=Sebastes umbrosus TaxID=72105 RepID=UPI00189EF415|nr:protein POF1B isoform X2 [Sebastes umbrosus]
MSVHTSSQKTTTFRTVNVASPEPVSSTVISSGSVSPMQYTLNGGGGAGGYETVRYLIPVQQQIQQQQQPYFIMQQPMVQQTMVQPMVQQHMIQQHMVQQPMVQQMVSPVYSLQGYPRLSVSSQESADLNYQVRSTMENYSGQSSSVFSQSSSPIKSPEPSAEEEEEEEVEEEEEEEEEVEEKAEETVVLEETEIISMIQQRPSSAIQKTSRTEVRTELSEIPQRTSRTEVRTELREIPQHTKLDTRYFGELLADVYRKNCDIHTCISEHVSKIRGQKHQLDPSNDYKVEKEEVEALLPKGATELTKQQIRYLLQTRLTADKSMRLLLSTFSSLREELLHMSKDLRRLESEKESLERDLSFKADQARQYDCLLEAVRENNRQLQTSLKETSCAQRSLETQLMSTKNTESSSSFKIKEMDGRMRALEKENEMLRQKLAGQGSSTTLHIKTEELSRQYKDQLSSMRTEKDLEIQKLQSQITKITTEVTAERSSSEKSLQLKISEMLTVLDQRQTTITKQEEEIKKLIQERNDSAKSQITKTTITKRYRNQYPILGLLSDDYNYTSPIKENKTIVIERSGEMIKQEIITSP